MYYFNMKILLKIIKIIFGLILLLITIWYFYFWKRFSTLQEVDRQQIIESFMPDSNGKGYSDNSEKIIENDVKLVSKVLSEKELEDFSFWFKEFYKRRRILLLSKDRTFFKKNARNYYIAFECFSRYAPKMDGDSLFFSDKISSEKEVFFKYKNILEKRNFSFLSFDEVFEIQNPVEEKDYSKCFDYFRLNL